jgi:hypothetical protein
MTAKRKTRASTDMPAQENEQATPEASQETVNQEAVPQQVEPTEGQQPVETTTETAAVEPTAEQPKPDAKKPAKAPRPLKGMMVDLKTLVWNNPTMDADALLAELKKLGHTPSKTSVQTIRADFLHSMRCLAFLGVKGLGKFVVKE